MFVQTWKKYLPVIAILVKRSVNGEQTLDMNPSDFQRATAGRKVKFSFSNLRLNDGRMDNTVKHTPIVKEFAQLLQDHDLIRPLLRKQNLEFAMNNKFQLLIRNNTAPVNIVLPEETAETESNEPDQVTDDSVVTPQ